MVSNTRFTRMASAATVVILPMLLGLSTAWLAGRTTSVPKFRSGVDMFLLANDTFTGRKTAIALTSPNNAFELAVIQDGFGTSTRFQYCWAEVHDSATGSHLLWRRPCNPLKVNGCELLFKNGNLRLLQASGDNLTEALLSKMAGEGAVDVKLANEGVLTLVAANKSVVWWASDELPDDSYRQQQCKEVFHPLPSSPIGSGSHLMRFPWFGAASSITLSAIMAVYS